MEFWEPRLNLPWVPFPEVVTSFALALFPALCLACLAYFIPSLNPSYHPSPSLVFGYAMTGRNFYRWLAEISKLRVPWEYLMNTEYSDGQSWQNAGFWILELIQLPVYGISIIGDKCNFVAVKRVPGKSTHLVHLRSGYDTRECGRRRWDTRRSNLSKEGVVLYIEQWLPCFNVFGIMSTLKSTRLGKNDWPRSFATLWEAAFLTNGDPSSHTQNNGTRSYVHSRGRRPALFPVHPDSSTPFMKILNLLSILRYFISPRWKCSASFATSRKVATEWAKSTTP